MKNIICFILCTIMLFTVAACGTEKSENSAEQQTAAPSEAEQASFEWTRQGYFQDENENMLSVTWMEDIDEPGWYVGCMLGEDWIEDSWGGTLPQKGSTLHGALPSSGSKDDITVTVSEEGEDGVADETNEELVDEIEESVDTDTPLTEDDQVDEENYSPQPDPPECAGGSPSGPRDYIGPDKRPIAV